MKLSSLVWSGGICLLVLAQVATVAGAGALAHPDGGNRVIEAPTLREPQERSDRTDLVPVAITPRSRPSSFRLPAAVPLAPIHDGTEQSRGVLASSGLRPTALASGDFDEDGFRDLVSGYSGPGGHLITLHRGNEEAVFPRGLVQAGVPLLVPASTFAVPERPDFIGVGDFDGDGHLDVVLGTSGAVRLWALPGNGHGAFGEPHSVSLDGRLTAMTVGEINRADGLVDIVVGVTGERGGAVLVFEDPEGALAGSSERIALPGVPGALLLGRLNDDPPRDLAIGVGNELLVVAGRDRQLSLHEERRGNLAAAATERVARLDGAIVSLALGDFVAADRSMPELAALTEMGRVHLFGRRIATGSDWMRLGQQRLLDDAAGARMLTARVSNLPLDELVVLDGNGRLHLILGQTRTVGTVFPDDLGPPWSTTLDGRPVAILAERFGRGPSSDLVLLSDHSIPPAVISAPVAVILVNDPAADPGFGPGVGDGVCSFSEAITNANGNADFTAGDCAAGTGSDAIAFAVGTISVVTALPPLTDFGDTVDGTTFGCVNVEGFSFGAGGPGLRLGGRSVIRGLAVWGFAGTGISIGPPSVGNVLETNRIGLDCAGGAVAGNTTVGIEVIDSRNNLIGGPGAGKRNIVSFNGTDGIRIVESAPGSSLGTRVQGNYVGTDPAGSAGFGNGLNGIQIDSADDLDIGGVGPGDGNLISGNSDDGVELIDFVDPPRANRIQGNRIGTDATGALAIPNGISGVFVAGGDSNTIGGTAPTAGNLLSGNVSIGALLDDSTVAQSVNNLVQGNFVGTDATGTLPVANGNTGILILDSPDNVIGGAVPGAGNLVSGNATFGIGIANFTLPGVSDSNTIQGNTVGLDSTGTVAVGSHGASGIIVQDSSFTLVGGGLPGEGNISSGNTENGIFVNQSAMPPPTDNTVQGNRVGTDVAGTTTIGNGRDGIVVLDSSNNQIGGTAPGEGNIAGGSGICGIRVTEFSAIGTSTGNVIEGNHAGLDPGGVSIPNSACGIGVEDASGNTIGGVAPGAGNVAWNNFGSGIVVSAGIPQPSVGNSILGNSVFSNVTLGIDLGFNGPTLNDPMDTDAGPNRYQNFPVITRADVGLSETIIEGTLNSTPGATFRTELFSTPGCDATGFGQGRDFLGSTTVTTNAVGDGSFNVVLPQTLTIGEGVAATATDVATGDTSEFSACANAAQCIFATFGQTIFGQDETRMVWAAPANARFARGFLAGVDTYATFGGGMLLGATNLDISLDVPAVNGGFYYLLRLSDCGSWQTNFGNEPGRDLALP